MTKMTIERPQILLVALNHLKREIKRVDLKGKKIHPENRKMAQQIVRLTQNVRLEKQLALKFETSLFWQRAQVLAVQCIQTVPEFEKAWKKWSQRVPRTKR